MIPFSNIPWQVSQAEYFVSNSNGEIVAYVPIKMGITDEERSTILRAIASLPQMLDSLQKLMWTFSELHNECMPLTDNEKRTLTTIREFFAYIAPVETLAEVLTNRWLHAQQQPLECIAAETAFRQLTLSLSDTLNGDMSHYPVNVQDAFAQAMSLLALAKHRPQFTSTNIKDGDSSQIDISPMFTTPQVYTVDPADYIGHPAVTDYFKNRNEP